MWKLIVYLMISYSGGLGKTEVGENQRSEDRGRRSATPRDRRSAKPRGQTTDDRGRKAEIGHQKDRHRRVLEETPLLPIGTLFAIGPDSDYYSEADLQGVFYAQSWAMVHYLMIGIGDGGAGMGRFLGLLRGLRWRLCRPCMA